MRLAFAGTPDFARAALEALIAAGHDVVLVLTQPDRPAGRGQKTLASPVKDVALRHGLPVLQPRSLRPGGKFPDDAAQALARLSTFAPEAMVVAAYGLIIPAPILDVARHGCINIHASLLPRWRGAAPIERAIEAGDEETGICIMQMDEGLDTGPILAVEHEPILPDDNGARLRARLSERGARLIVAALAQIEAGVAKATPQASEGASYARKLSKEESALSFAADAEVLARRVRAFDPQPGATLRWGSQVIKVWAAHAEAAPSQGAPGTVLESGASGLRVACGTGVLCITELQRPGGRRLAAREFLQGNALAPGEVLA